jgi:hypothetical protein
LVRTLSGFFAGPISDRFILNQVMMLCDGDDSGIIVNLFYPAMIAEFTFILKDPFL